MIFSLRFSMCILICAKLLFSSAQILQIFRLNSRCVSQWDFIIKPKHCCHSAHSLPWVLIHLIRILHSDNLCQSTDWEYSFKEKEPVRSCHSNKNHQNLRRIWVGVEKKLSSSWKNEALPYLNAFFVETRNIQLHRAWKTWKWEFCNLMSMLKLNKECSLRVNTISNQPKTYLRIYFCLFYLGPK